MGAMIAALELEDFVTLAIRAGYSQSEEGRLRARRGEAHLFGAGYRLTNLLRQLDDGLIHHEERAAGLDLLAYSGDHGWMRVAENERTRR